MSRSAWNSSTPAGETYTLYDPIKDPHCPHTKTNKFVKHMDGYVKKAKAERKSQLRKQSRIGVTLPKRNRKRRKSNNRKSSTARFDVDDLSHSPPSRHVQSFEQTISSGAVSVPAVSFQNPRQAADPALELEILKCILLREGYLSRLQDEVHKGRALVESKAAAAKLVDLLDLIRQVTVETCEAIQRWRYTSKRPFMWNSTNYLLKVSTDLDFLDKVRPIVSWLGFSMNRNPFIVPMSLDFRVPTPGPKAMRRAWESNPNAFHSIGGKSSGVPPTIEENTEVNGTKSRNHNAIPSDMAVTARAYGAAAAGVGIDNGAGSDQTKKSPDAKRVEILRMMPSQIGDVDMLRIREAEKMILHEERENGRLVRDDDGKLVPEIIWQQLQALKEQQEMLAKRGGRQDLHGPPLGSPGDSGRVSSANPDIGRNNKQLVLKSSGQINDPSTTTGVTPVHQSLSSSRQAHIMQPRQNTGPLRGRKQSLKDGGQLVPLSTAGTTGGERRPKARSHLAQLDADIKRDQRDNDRLLKKLDRVKQELEKEEAAIRGIEEEVIETGARPPPDIRLRKIRFEEKFAEYERQEKELARRLEETANKELKRKMLKERRRADAERSRRAVIERKRLQGLGAGSLEALDDDVEVPDDEKAAIQIQKVVRGKLGKVHVGVRRRVFNDAAQQMQRVRRGQHARDRVRRMRKQEAATIVIQRRSRGLLDRKRAAQARHTKLVHLSARLLQSTFRRHLGQDRMKKRREFVSAKKAILRSAQQLYPSYLAQLRDVEEPAPLLLTRTLNCAMLLLDRTLKPDPADGVTWRTLMDFQESEQFLPAIRRLAHDAYRETLALPRARVAQVEVFFHDPNFSVQAVSAIRPGGKACALLLEWVRAALVVNKLTPLFADRIDMVTDAIYWDNAAEVIELERKANERAPKTYIVDGVLPEQPSRPRPIVVCMARDVPLDRKEKLVTQLQELLPDVFVRVNQPTVDMAVLQNSLDVGKSIVLDIDMGNSHQHRRRFLALAELIRKTLSPTPLMVAVEGDRSNRHGGGAAVKFGVGRDDAMLMVDWDLKQRLEEVSEQLFLLNLDESIDQLSQLGQKVVNAPPELVLLFEAAMIALTPQHRFQTPTEASPLVTWPAARKMLNDASTFVRRMSMIDVDAIPLQNLLVLQAYRQHPRWPTDNSVPGGQGEPPYFLMKLLDNLVEYATMLDRAGGAPSPVVTKGGTFGAVIKINDTVDPRQQFVQVITPTLRDMKIYAQAHRIQREHLVISVFRDCRQFIFVAYDPKTGLQYHTAVPEEMADVLLAPNSIESATDPRPPPETLTELCARLTELLQLELEPVPKGQKVRNSERRKELWLRRKLVRLCRVSQRIGPVLTTVTASEAQKQEILLDVYVPRTSKQYRLNVTEEDFLKIEADALDEAGAELEAVRARDPFKMARHVIDRLEFRRGQLRLRVTGGGGRRLMEAGIVLNGVRVVASIFYSDTAGVRLQVYVPTASDTHRFYLAPREMKDLLGDCSLSGKMVWQQLLLKRLSVQNRTRVIFDRCLYKESVNVGGIYLTVECCALGPDGGIELVAYRNDTSEVWKLSVSDDELNDVICTDDEKRQGVKVWPARVEDMLHYNKVCSRMPASLSWDTGSAADGTARDPGLVLQFGEGVVSATAEGKVEAAALANDMSTKNKQASVDDASGTSSADRLAAATAPADDSKTNNSSSETSPDVESKIPARQQLASQKQAKNYAEIERTTKADTFRRGRLLCSFAYKRPAWSSTKGSSMSEEQAAMASERIITCSSYDDDDVDGELRLVVYDSQRASGAACALAAFEVQRAVGQRLELLVPERRFEMAEFLLRERLRILPIDADEVLREPIVGRYATDGEFAVRFDLSRVYSQTRATPFPVEGAADRLAQMESSTVIAGGIQRRGRKVLTSGMRIDAHRVVVTAFAVELPPQLRFSVYLPEASLKYAVSDISKSVAAQVAAGVGDDAGMKALAQERLPQLKLRYADGGDIIGVELMPRDEALARAAMEELERQRVAAGGKLQHGGRKLKGEARQLVREGIRLQNLKVVLTVWGDVVEVKADNKFGEAAVLAAKKQGQLVAGDVRKFWAVIEDPASGQAADCDLPVDAVLAQTGGEVDAARLLRVQRLLIARRQPTQAAVEAARAIDKREAEDEEQARRRKAKSGGELTADDAADSAGDSQDHLSTEDRAKRKAQDALATETKLQVRYSPLQVLQRAPFVLGETQCLSRISAQADILVMELIPVEIPPGRPLLLSPSKDLPALTLLSTADRLQLTSLLLESITERTKSGKFEGNTLMNFESLDNDDDAPLLNLQSRVQQQFDEIYAAVVTPVLANADNAILFAAFERFLRNKAAHNAAQEARVKATTDGLDPEAIEAAAATAATAGAVQVVVSRATEMIMKDLEGLLDDLDWAGLYASDCFKFLDRPLDGCVTFDEFRRWQEFAWANNKGRRGPSRRALLETFRDKYLAIDDDEAGPVQSDILSDDEEENEQSDQEENENQLDKTTSDDVVMAQDAARNYLDNLYSQLDGNEIKPMTPTDEQTADASNNSDSDLHPQLQNVPTLQHQMPLASSQMDDVDRDIMKKAFDEIDVDRGGSLSREEMEQFLRKLGWIDEVTVDETFAFLDRDPMSVDNNASGSGENESHGSGPDRRISFDEFLRWHDFAWTKRVHAGAGGISPLVRSQSSRRSLKRFQSGLDSLGEVDEEDENDGSAADGEAQMLNSDSVDNQPIEDAGENTVRRGDADNIDEDNDSQIGIAPSTAVVLPAMKNTGDATNELRLRQSLTFV